MRSPISKLGQHGDTIVEVLIACTVVGMVLVSSFAVVNRTLNNSRQSQEHEEALKVAESQLEALKGLTGATYSTIFTSVSYQFCVQTDNVTIKHFSNDTYDKTRVDDTTYYPTECQRTTPGGYKYNISIHKDGIAAHKNVFFVNVDWYGPTGGIDDVGLIYELYQ
jgi:Tfp pilus assembly protein PilV